MSEIKVKIEVYAIGATRKQGKRKDGSDYDFCQIEVIAPYKNSDLTTGYFSSEKNVYFCSQQVFEDIKTVELPAKLAIEINPMVLNQNIESFDLVNKK